VNDIWPALVAVGGVILTLIVSTLGNAFQARQQQQTLILQLNHERDLAEHKHRVTVEDNLRREERTVLVELLTRDSDLEDLYKEIREVLSLAHQVDDEVLQALARDMNRPDMILERASYLLRTPKANRTDQGHSPSTSGTS
jgi:hypothetical protein